MATYPELDPVAAIPQKLPGWWARLCWSAFVVLAAVAFGGLAAIPGEHGLREVVRWVVFCGMALSFVLATINTYLAANCFDKRRRAQLDWLNAAGEKLAAAESKLEKTRTLDRFLQLGSSSDPKAIHPWQASAKGAVAPEPYSRKGSKRQTDFTLYDYVKLLDEEVHAARTAAAKLAAAFGGLTVILLQVYSRLV